MAKPKDLAEPILDCRIDFVEFACEEVIDALHNQQMIFARQRGNQRPDFLDCSVLVLASMHEKLRLLALTQKRKISAVDRNSQTN